MFRKKKSAQNSLGILTKLKNDVQARCRQATDLSIFLHTSLTGRPQMTKMSFPCSMGSIKKKQYFIENMCKS